MMKPLQSQDNLDEMRKRLYDRGAEAEKAARHQLTDEKVDVSRNWSLPSQTRRGDTNDLRQGMAAAGKESGLSEAPSVQSPRRHYRSFVLLGSFFIFAFVALISTMFWYFGGNQISSDNIQVTIEGQSLIGGGEVMSLEVLVANQNTVPIESATLILRYPNGTRSVGDSPRNLFEERIPLDDVGPGEIQKVPVKVAVFGEENAEKKIEASVEYRINGSNGMFYKDANPLAFRISSSPLVLRIDNVEKVASGQRVDLTITAVSNASSPLEDILITASYPNGFDFESSTPAPIYGENVWKIDKLLPEASTTIKLRGIVRGLTDETFRINFAAGPANPDNQYLVGSTLTDARADFIIERPFIDVAISINGDRDGSAILPEADGSSVGINIKNTLEESVYDMIVEVVPGGNALDEDSIASSNGFYDSNTGTVRWEVSNNPSFAQINPGDTRGLSFSLNPGPLRTEAFFNMVVNVYARRVAETSAQETLIGSVTAEAKYSSHVAMRSQVSRDAGSFTGSGPIPPKVGEFTTYAVTLVAEAGANNVGNAIVETSLPIYVNWLDMYEGDGTLTYNTVSKNMVWDIGDITRGQRKELTFQVSIQPSLSQLGTSPVLVRPQSLKANDRYTGVLLQDSAGAVTTELSTEMGFEKGDGAVVR
ncbi:hypothetical protein KC902_02280 [Candidatus Kaiserbacteria bacterium]|nr:hypothetical protein [Candidatus Kaiserbacteria bacterium]